MKSAPRLTLNISAMKSEPPGWVPERTTALLLSNTRPFTVSGPSGDSEWLAGLLSLSHHTHLRLRFLSPARSSFFSSRVKVRVECACVETMLMKLESNERGCWSCRQARFVRRSARLLCRCHPAVHPLLLCLHLAFRYRPVGSGPPSKPPQLYILSLHCMGLLSICVIFFFFNFFIFFCDF